MPIENKVSPEDKLKVLNWLQKYAFGFRNARTRANILPFMGNGNMPDRHFRLILAELKKEGSAASTCTRGIWAVPPVTTDAEEIEAVLESCLEMKTKALDMLTGLNRQIELFQAKKEALTTQIVMEFVAEAENG